MAQGSPTKICSVEDCARLVRARDLCSTHYNQRHQPERHKKIDISCSWCGRATAKAPDRTRGYEHRFCSHECRNAWREATGYRPSEACHRASRETLASRRHKAQVKLRRAARGTTGHQWVAGWCERCGEAFVGLKMNLLDRFCSERCNSRTKASWRRARERNAVHERYSRHKIFERDGWRCHICRRKTLRTAVVPHPRAPVLDHLVPLAEGGDDTAANLATACFICNSTKRECGGNEQLALVG